jgi:outer membrane protein OmpA-like peptidoglycan-associated protein
MLSCDCIMPTLSRSLCAGLAGVLLAGVATADPEDRPRAPVGADFIEAKPARTGSELATSDGERPLAPSAQLLFAFDSTQIDRRDASELVTARDWILAHPKELLVVEGYADNTGSAAYNFDLSKRRTAVVKDRLVALGVPSDRIVTGAFGESRALANADAASRRVVVRGTTDYRSGQIARR